LGLEEEDITELDRYITDLKRSQIRLRDCEDELIWDSAPSGIYTPKDGYTRLNLDLFQREPVWWWKKLWKLKCPAKTRLFMWNVLSNKVSTWDILQKRNNHGPGWCYLCKSEGESTLHIFLECRYIKEVWNEFRDFWKLDADGLVIRWNKLGRIGGWIEITRDSKLYLFW
jgi:hypothetical protein